jgi:hypothetical protein
MTVLPVRPTPLFGLMSEEFRRLQERYARLLKQLAPHKPAYMFQNEIQTHRLDEGSPHVELVDGKYDYVVTERGSELQRRTARDEDELLYWLMSDVTKGIAIRLEARHRRRGQDSRRQWFARDVELLGSLNPEWGERKRLEYIEVLSTYPFRDKA